MGVNHTIPENVFANHPRGFTGHEMLDEVGLVHMNGRLYDAELGRFIQADPIIQDPLKVQSLNRYSYVWNNPLNATDPTGFLRKNGADDYEPPIPDESESVDAKNRDLCESHDDNLVLDATDGSGVGEKAMGQAAERSNNVGERIKEFLEESAWNSRPSYGIEYGDSKESKKSSEKNNAQEATIELTPLLKQAKTDKQKIELIKTVNDRFGILDSTDVYVIGEIKGAFAIADTLPGHIKRTVFDRNTAFTSVSMIAENSFHENKHHFNHCYAEARCEAQIHQEVLDNAERLGLSEEQVQRNLEQLKNNQE